MRFLCLATSLVLFAATEASGQTVGLYADPNGTDCNVVTQLNVPVTAYLVLGPGLQPVNVLRMNVRVAFQDGTSGLVLAATPGAAVLSTSGNLFSSGTIVVLNGLCPLPGPVVLYTITITRTSGSGSARGVETFADWTACGQMFSTPTLLRSTLDGVSSPPAPPSNPVPADGATDVRPSAVLAWSSQLDQYQCRRVSSRLYFGTDPNPPLFAAALEHNSFSISSLQPATTYFWRVESHFAPAGTVLTGPVWQFTTEQVCPQTCETQPPACPVVCAFTYPDDFFGDRCSDAIAAELSSVIPCLSWSVDAWASFDRTLGSISVRSSDVPECFGSVSDLIAADRFWLVGPPAGQPVAFTARLAFTVSGQGFPSARGALREGAGPADFQSPSPLELAQQHLPGEEFILRYGVRVFPWFLGAQGTGELTFDLPDGYSIESCAGYGSTVPATPVSWSGVKSLYR